MAKKTIPSLQATTYAAVQALCATLDDKNIAELESQWREWLNSPSKTHPRNPDAAFIAFCRNKLKG